MSFILSRSFAHLKIVKSFPKASSSPLRSALRIRHTVVPLAARRAFQESARQTPQPANGELMRKLAVGAAAFGGTLIITNAVFNRETREDGGMPLFERAYLNDTFMHTGLGIGIIGLSARAMFQSGFTYRLMATNPWVVMIGGLALSIGTMMGTRAVEPTK
jgi:hypothetical protein